MQYRKMGESGLELSVVSIGGWLTFGGSIDDRDTKKVLHTALDGGVNFIDLADVYSHGKAEKAARKALHAVKRRNVVLSSKVFFRMSDDMNDRGLSRKHIMESCERSLRRLGTDYLDLYFCHRSDPSTPLEETARAMDDLVHQGKVLYWGTSVWPAELLRRAHDLATVKNLYACRVEQPEYSLMKRDIEAEVLPTCRDLGLGVVCWSPLAGGALTGKYDNGVPEESRGAKTEWLKDRLSEANLARLRQFSTVARELGVTPAQLALGWVLRQDGITSVITGATCAAQMQENLGAVDVALSDEVAAQLALLFPRT
ncbi:MAG: aldo/keto reductase family protein [Planctomycetota bacterium]